MIFLLIVVFFISCGTTRQSAPTGVSTSPSSAGSSTSVGLTTVTKDYFGMHVHDPANWPAIPFGSLRLWDAGVAWPQLEPTKGQWNFGTLDTFVTLSLQNKVNVLLVLGLSPQWASARPSEPSAYNPGNAAEPANIQDWRDYVQAVATRYKGQIHEYEIWNEPNDPTFFSGTPDKLLQLASEAYTILKQVDPTVVVVSPAATEASSLPYLDNYLSIGGGNYADVIAYHFYVSPNPPESIASLANQVKTIMAAHGQGAKPLWSTESGWHPPATFSTTADEAAYVARAYLVASSGAARYYWYAWDDHDWVSLQLTNSDGSLRPSAQAFSQVTNWLLNSQLSACSANTVGVWVCALTQSDHSAHILWNPGGTASFTVPGNWNAVTTQDLSGTVAQIPNSGLIQIGSSPLLLR